MDNIYADILSWETKEGMIQDKYQHTIKGFAAHLSEDSVQKLCQSPMVKYVEEDSIVRALEVTSWGLDRLDQRYLPLDNSTRNRIGDGTGTHIYILDTGVRYSHDEFNGRTGDGFDLFNDGVGVGMDCRGHGTHVAGTAAGSTFGVAPNATVHSVRVLSCTGGGLKSITISGMEWVAAHVLKPAVLSMSLGGSYSQSQNDAVEKLTNMGIVVSVAAGNANSDACEESPASAPAAITVGSTDIDDQRSFFSNIGRCVDIFAPGGYLPSAGHNSNNATATLRGTSMACPHVSGAAAILLSIDENLVAHEVKDMILRAATLNKVGNARFLSPNRLLYIGDDTCMTRCGFTKDVYHSCQCDPECSDRGDCCTDYPNLCWDNAPTCGFRCGNDSNDEYPCQCDSECMMRQDCCQDYTVLCRPNNVCDDTVSSGIFYSPYYPDNYMNNLTCGTLIYNDEDSKPVLNMLFSKFDLEESANCINDSLTIYDGANDTSPLIGTFCKTEDIPDYLQATGRNLFAVFKTDSSVTAKGFSIRIRNRPGKSLSLFVCHFAAHVSMLTVISIRSSLSA
ncbi:extracellular serine proteinase-like [Amphiura filiformis]|uniref:extracellular serine proteinase-like n=1 Tax=Amphiura filiformis TaxID=82378 RepID=UPI003B21A71D